MKPTTPRPVFLNLLQIRLPLGGVLSIMHRVSGVFLVLAIPVLIYFLQLLNGGGESFAQAQALLQTLSGKLVLTLITWILIQHSMSGIRHLLMDLDFSYDKHVARTTARVAFACSSILIVVTGILIWL
ncbi:MAG: succinate dehydrogenase, cytochrome b556 subunit [Gammaproteobacteria bacterium]|nr:succinate dehydrogenase, cytochrome b556 subunit [Gammaproteobacteria bacterium]